MHYQITEIYYQAKPSIVLHLKKEIYNYMVQIVVKENVTQRGIYLDNKLVMNIWWIK